MEHMTLRELREFVLDFRDLPDDTEVRFLLEHASGDEDPEFLSNNGQLFQDVEDDNPAYVALSFRATGEAGC